MDRLVAWSLVLRPDAMALCVPWSDEDLYSVHISCRLDAATRAGLLLFLGILASGILATQVVWLLPGAD